MGTEEEEEEGRVEDGETTDDLTRATDEELDVVVFSEDR